MTALPITEPGEFSLTKEQYEADPCEVPSLRSSIAWILASQTPAHAWHGCKRLNPKYLRVEKKHFDHGTIAHQMLLGQPPNFDVIDAPNFMKKDARMARDSSYRLGRTPILEHELVEIEEMVSSVRHQLGGMVDYGSLEAMPFQNNETERCIVWREDNGAWCRAALDGLSLDGDVLSEFKTEAESANPEQWQWKARRLGYVFKLCFYCRGLSKLGIAHSPSARFFVAEKAAPYLLSMVRVDDELLMKENQRVLDAIKLWGRCLAQDRWPGYSIEGYDLTLTDRERMAEQMAGQMSGAGAHVSSEDIAAGL